MELQTTGATARQTTVDYLGFINWWIASISVWDANMDMHTTTVIKNMELHHFPKRGTLVDLEKDWHEINIPNLVQH